MKTPGTDVENLLRYDEVVRRLARDLMRDEQEAEDLAQDAWVAALDGRSHPPHSWPAWMAGVVRKLAARTARGEGRRRAREQSVSRNEAVPSTTEILEREGARRAVVEAMVQLEEPYRSTLILRYFENLPPRVIARRLGVPVETVRTRSKRGLERMRLRLDDVHGGERTVWCLPLLPLLTMPPAVPIAVDTAPLPSLLTKLAVMSTKTKLAIAAVLVLGATLAFIKLTESTANGEGPPHEFEGREHAPGLAAEHNEQDTEAASLEATTDERQKLAPDNEPATPLTSEFGSLLVRVTSQRDEAPIAEEIVGLYIWSNPNPYFNRRFGETDADGIVVFDRMPPGTVTVQAHRSSGTKSRANLEISAGEQATANLLIPIGTTVQGEVLDNEGQPVPHAEIWVSNMGNMTQGLILDHSDEKGRFVLRSLGTPRWIGARKAGYAPSTLPSVMAAEGATVPLQLVLPGIGGSVDGIVLDPSGKPVPGAAVLVGSSAPHTAPLPDGSYGFKMPGQQTVTDQEGRFTMDGLELGPTPITVRASGFGLWRGKTHVEAEFAAKVEVRLQPGVTLLGRVFLPPAEPVERALVSTGGFGFDYFRTATLPDGSYRLEDLPAEELVMLASKDKVEVSKTFHASPGETIHWDVVLEEGQVIRLRVVDEMGQGRPRCGVEISSTPDESGRIPSHDFGVTGKDGRVRFTGCTAPEYTIEIRPPGGGIFALERLEGIQPDQAEILVTLGTEMDPSVRIHGTLLEADGSPAGAATLMPHFAGSASPIETVDAKTGRFEFGPYPPGSWRLAVQHPSYPDHHFGPKTLNAGETWDLGEIRLAEGGQLTVLLSRDGVTPEQQAMLYLKHEGQAYLRPLKLELDVAKAESLAPGSYTLILSGNGIASRSLPFEILTGRETMLNLVVTAGVSCVITINEEATTKAAVVDLVVRDRSGQVVYQSPIHRSRQSTFVHGMGLEPGTYTIEAATADGRRAQGELELVEGRTPQLELLLKGSN